MQARWAGRARAVVGGAVFLATIGAIPRHELRGQTVVATGAAQVPAKLALSPRPDKPRFACPFRAGARAAGTLGPRAPAARDIPIRHVLVVMQENRSFDHYFGRLSVAGQPEAEGFPAGFTNPDADGRSVAPFHLPTTCFPRDPPHQWANVHAQWNAGRMDGFVTSADDDDGDGRWAMGYYDERDIPFYYWLANTFSIADRYFSAALGGTWPNRQFLYTGTAAGPRARTGLLTDARTLFDALDGARVPWRVYSDGPPRQDCIGWRRGARGVEGLAAFEAALATGKLPPVAFLDASVEDEHPPSDVQRGERWMRALYRSIVRSPLWPDLAVFLTYDEGGGFFDHVAPPEACPPDPTRPELDHDGTRVPLLVISPFARGHHVSHAVHDHASILRFIELLHDLPALTDRDANADALLDLFDFSAPRLLTPPVPVAAGHGGCRPVALARR